MKAGAVLRWSGCILLADVVIGLRRALTENKVEKLDDDGTPNSHGNDLTIGPTIRSKALSIDDLDQGDKVQDIDDQIGRFQQAPEPKFSNVPMTLKFALGSSTRPPAPPFEMLRLVVPSKRPHDLVDDQHQHSDAVDCEENHLIE